ncbi:MULTISPECIES: hypothetical protein [Natrialbaceae]|uniref:hypothetical protein n=1 Tax=Natrialbaceae TaxID=1644061 RepID=UPI00207C8B9E|nr:hypothetical protein [Natronococcus sp. CG52]
MSENESPDESNERDVSRRSYMQLLGAVGLGTGVQATMSGNDVAAAAPDGEGAAHGITVSDSGTDVSDGITRLDFEGSLSPAVQDGDTNSVQVQSATNPNVVNVRVDLGVRPRQDDLWAAIRRHYNSFSPANRNHLYVVPAETWFVRSNNLDLPSHRFFGLVGEPTATLRVNDQNVDRMMTVGRINTSAGQAQRTVMRDLRIDITGDYDSGIGRWYTHGCGRIENIRLVGQRNRGAAYGGDLHTIMIDGRTPETTNIIRNVHLNDGDTYHGREGPYALAFSSEVNNVGVNIWEGCQVSGFKTSAFYASSNSGRNIYQGCHARNCGGGCFRLGADDYMYNCRITMDEHPGRAWSGLWLQLGSGQVVNGLRVHNEVEKDTEIVRLTQDGSARISNMHIVDEGTDGRAIRVSDDDNSRTVFEGCSLIDRSSPTISDYPIYVRSSNVTFKDCEYDIDPQSNVDRHGIFVSRQGTNVDRLSLDHCEIDTDGASLRFGESGREHNITNSFFEGIVMSDSRTTLQNVLWVGNRHRAQTIFNGQRTNWQGDFNFGYSV